MKLYVALQGSYPDGAGTDLEALKERCQKYATGILGEPIEQEWRSDPYRPDRLVHWRRDPRTKRWGKAYHVIAAVRADDDELRAGLEAGA